MNNHPNSGVFIILFIQLFIFTVFYVLTVKKLTRYLEAHHAEEFRKRRIPQAWAGSRGYFTPRNIMKLYLLPYLLLFTSLAELDSFSTAMVKRARLIISAQVLLFILFIFWSIF